MEVTSCYYEVASDLSWSFLDSSPTLNAQLFWWVDPSGNDDADGKTLETALVSVAELNMRLWPFGRKQNLTTDVTIRINTTSPNLASIAFYPQLVLNVGTNESTVAGFTLNVIAGKVSSAPIVLSSNAVIPIATSNQRGQFACSSGAFIDDELIEVISGQGIGGVGYCAGLNGDSQHCFYTGLSVPTIAGSLVNGGHGQDIKPLAGDSVVVTRLATQFGRIEIECSGYARVFIQYVKTPRVSINGQSVNTPFAGVGGPVFLSCCQQTSPGGRWENNCGGATLLQCRTIRGGYTALVGSGWCVIGHVVQGRLGLSGQCVSYGMNLDGGQLRIGNNDNSDHPGQADYSKWLLFSSYTNLFSGGSSGCIEFSRGALRGPSNDGIAVMVCDASEFWNTDFNGYLWGDTSAPNLYAIGLWVFANSWAEQGNISPGVLAATWKIPSIINMMIDNLTFSFSDNPVSLKNSNCGLIGSNYNVANNYNETDSGFYRTAQNANVAATPFLQIKKSGMYRVMGYVSVTTADAAAVGTPVLNVLYTDDSGVQQTKVVVTGPALTTLGGVGGEVIIECGSSLALSNWSISGVTTPLTSKFSVRMRVEKDCFGQ